MKFAVFASGEGTNLQAIIDAVRKGSITAELVLVFSNNRKAGALRRAEEAGIPTLFLDRNHYATPQSYERDIVIHLKEAGVDFLVLAGYMKILTPFFIKKYPKKILNVHPSLLPAFKGARGIKDAFTYGVKVTGVTIHIVDEKMDHGPIIAQECVPVREDDTLETLEARIHEVEHALFPRVIQWFVEGRLKIGPRKVSVLSDNPPQ